MPPIIDDAESTPAGTITLKEGSSLNLKCFAEAKPEPQIKWYRWKKYKHLVSEKEELGVMGNEIVIPAVKRNDPNVYECIARNSVPPATSRIFNLETHCKRHYNHLLSLNKQKHLFVYSFACGRLGAQEVRAAFAQKVLARVQDK